MFNKLVSGIAFNPSMINQLVFYGQRLKKEQSIRRLGLFFIILSMFVQLFAAMVPAEKSLAYSDNHIINGIKTKQDILRAWDRPGSDVPEIYHKFGLTRQDIANLPTKPNATIRSSSSNNYWSIGRNSLSGYSNIKQQYKSKEIALKTDGPTVFFRPLHAWDTKTNYTSYKAFKGRNSTTGKTFWILVDCGNYAQVGNVVAKEKPKKAKLEVRKTIVSKSNRLKAGDTFTFKIEYRNKEPDSLAENVKIEDQLDTKHFDVVSPRNLSIKNGKLTHDAGNLKYTKTKKVLNLRVKLKESLNTNATVCNAVRLTASNAESVTSGGSPNTCIEVVKTCPNNPNLVDDGSNCNETATCVLTDAVRSRTNNTIRLSTTSTTSDNKRIIISGYDYDYGDGTKESHKTSSLKDVRDHAYAPGVYMAKVTVNYVVDSKKNSSKQSSCTAPVEIVAAATPTQTPPPAPTPTPTPTPAPPPPKPEEPKTPVPPATPEEPTPPSLSKEVKNITQNFSGDAALNSKVRAGDVIEYTLITGNSQSFDITNYDISDYIGDVTDYADVDMAFLGSQGGTYDSNTKRIVWANQTLSAKSENAKVFRVVMKNPIPSTNSPSRVSTNFDCKLSNEYGDELSMDVECPVLKTVEELPNTGPGTTIAIAFTITAISGYFFARARLLAKEVGIIKRGHLV